MDTVSYTPGSIMHDSDYEHDYRIVIAKIVSKGTTVQVVLNRSVLGYFSDLSMHIFFKEDWSAKSL